MEELKMDLYSYVNSNDIREYLQKIGYVFSSKEAAWLIFQSKLISLREKHSSWKWLINNMDDCELEERLKWYTEEGVKLAGLDGIVAKK